MPGPLALRKLCLTRSHSFASPARTHDRTESDCPYAGSLKAYTPPILRPYKLSSEATGEAAARRQSYGHRGGDDGVSYMATETAATATHICAAATIAATWPQRPYNHRSGGGDGVLHMRAAATTAAIWLQKRQRRRQPHAAVAVTTGTNWPKGPQPYSHGGSHMAADAAVTAPQR